MKTVFYKSAIVGLLLMGFSACSQGTYVLSTKVLNKIHPGMSGKEVCSVMGDPDFRRFNQNVEEWEYRKWLSGRDAVVIVSFENGCVVAMDSFEYPNVPQAPVAPVPPVVVTEQGPSQPVRMHRMNDAEFREFYQKVKAEPFSDEQNDMIRALSQSRRLTCKQCAQLLGFYNFDDDKLTAFRWFAPYIVDRENYNEILKMFDFPFGQEEVKKVLGI